MSEINLLEQTGVVQDLNARTLSYWCTEDVVGIDQQIVDQLLRVSEMNGNCDARICLHPSPGSNFHEMIILQHLGRYYRPHKHRGKGESCHIIQGRVRFFVFNDDGTVSDCSVVGGGHSMIFRAGTDLWHTVVPITDHAVYHESKPGPYLADTDSLFPTWAPDGSDSAEAKAYMNRLLRFVQEGPGQHP